VVRSYRHGIAVRREALAGVTVPFSQSDYGHGAHHLFVVLLPDGTERTRVMTMMREMGVQTSIHYPPTHWFSAYATDDARVHLSRTEAVFPRLLTLPLAPSMNDGHVNLVLDALASSLR
jgi:dTDP-4-amino-4,6-dideoxygalactose transaminase